MVEMEKCIEAKGGRKGGLYMHVRCLTVKDKYRTNGLTSPEYILDLEIFTHTVCLFVSLHHFSTS